ncbi:carbohydrate ABC transporter permease [Paenibacillus sp. WQ 127069]|uniref:Carbohydrate ABC transporter permease n=1 Tax=Paenibacillus baimaensis TaxID=2982185 RepID=A0ABT2U8Y3_9BACL|nr:carbohydrate ABC transporter permease [Paenibacillus sp. WQ 127069]MCU6791002.1 carbohydrate ABC transporter permease [Paenibacillus sp. WQ 127069]
MYQMVGARRSSKILWTVVLISVALLACCVVFPFFWMIMTSLKSAVEINRMPPTVLPELWQFQNYAAAWLKPESTFEQYFINTVIIAGIGTALQLLVCVPIAFAITHFSFRGRNLIFMLVVITMLIPYDVTLVPNFVTMRHIPFAGGNDWLGDGGQGFYDSYMGMMLPFLAEAFTIFLLRQAFLSVQKEYWEAAQVDGMSNGRYLWTVLLPLVLPSLITTALLAFIGKWNGVLWPLLITSSESLRPLQVGLLYFVSEEGPNYHLLMAAATFTIAPIVLLYVFAQRWFHQGITATGLKG